MNTNMIEVQRVSCRWLHLIWAALLCVAVMPVRAIAQPQEVLSAAAVSQRAKAAPGDQFAVAVILTLEPGWHVWPNKPVLPPGMEELLAIPTTVSVSKDFGAAAGVVAHTELAQWPTPHEIASAGFTGEPVKVLSYEKRFVVYVPVVIAKDAKPGEVIVPFDIEYQACDDSTCMAPTKAEASVKFEIAAAAEDAGAHKAEFAGFKPEVFEQIAAAEAALEEPGDPEAKQTMSVQAFSQRMKTAPGDQFAIAVVMTLEKGFHVWPNVPVLPKGFEDLKPFATVVHTAKGYEAPSGIRIHTDRAQWPAPHEIESAGFTGDPIKVLNYDGRFVMYVPITIGADAKAGEVEIPLAVKYQACTDTHCEQPATARTKVSFTVTTAVQAGLHENEFADFKNAVFAEIVKAAPKTGADTAPAPAPAGSVDAPPETSLFGFALPDPTSAVGIAVLLIVSIIGGAVMNVTPCVLPVIPIKVMTLTQHAGAGHGALRLGLWMAMGIVVFWTAIGVPMAFISSALDPSRFIFGIWWVTLAIGAIIIAMSLGLMGMFNLTLPQAVYAVNPKADTAWGSFLFGVMTAILGLPCFGFIAGGLLAAAAVMPAISTMSVFFGIGVGMAAPWLVLSAKPQLLKKMPRTGPASELVKQVMGLLLMAGAAYFIVTGFNTLAKSKPYVMEAMIWWAPALLLTTSAMWLIVRTFQITKKPARRAIVLIAGVALAIGSLGIAMSDTKKNHENHKKLLAAQTAAGGGFVTGAWNEYTPVKFEQARAAGKVVVADYTADWCLICHSLKQAVLDVNPVNAEIMSDDVVVFKVDLTAEDAPGWKFLQSIGRTGIPTLAIFTPGEEKPEVFNAYKSATVMEAMKRARAGLARK